MMGIVSLFAGHFDFRDLPGAGVELANVAAKIGGEPNVAIAIGGQAVRAGVLVVGERILLDLAGFGIEAADFVDHLFGEPKGTVGTHGGIVRVSALGGDRPLVDGDIELGHVAGTGWRMMTGRCESDENREKHDSRNTERTKTHVVPPRLK